MSPVLAYLFFFLIKQLEDACNHIHHTRCKRSSPWWSVSPRLISSDLQLIIMYRTFTSQPSFCQVSQLQSAFWCFSAIPTIRCNLCCKLGTFSGSTLSDMFSLVLNVRDSCKHIFCSKMVDNNLAQNVTYPAAGSKMIQKCLKIWDKMSHAITASPCSCCLNFAFATLQWLWLFFILGQHHIWIA